MEKLKNLWRGMNKGDRLLIISGLATGLVFPVLVVTSFVAAVSYTPPPVPQSSEEAPTKPAEPVTTYADVQETEPIPFEKTSRDDASLDVGTTKITTPGVDGVRTKTFHVTYVDGKETARTESKNEVTTQPVAEVTSVGTRVPYVAPAPVASSCDPNYSGACVPIASDVDCGGGSGNGPEYIYGVVQVVGSDIYGLDRDGDGMGCE